MRIISGTHKGKRLVAPKNLPVRPTTDFAKEALFNILNNRFSFADVTVLDLFAGTGNISFEFASRGCPKIVSVDEHFGCVTYIKKIADELSFPIQAIRADAFKYIAKATTPHDIVFADPPYNFDVQELSDIVDNILLNNLLKPHGIAIIEHTKHIDLSHLEHFDEIRKYGGSVFSFFKKNL